MPKRLEIRTNHSMTLGRTTTCVFLSTSTLHGRHAPMMQRIRKLELMAELGASLSNLTFRSCLVQGSRRVRGAFEVFNWMESTHWYVCRCTVIMFFQTARKAVLGYTASLVDNRSLMYPSLNRPSAPLDGGLELVYIYHLV